MTQLQAELTSTRDRLATTQALLTEALRELTEDQYASLRARTRHLDELGGFRHEETG